MRRLIALSLAFLGAIIAPITYPLTAQAQTIQTIGTNSARAYGFNLVSNTTPIVYPTFSYVLVGGGGGAGGSTSGLFSGGGGGGGLLAGSVMLPPATYTVTVGLGGAHGTTSIGPGTVGANGGASTFAGTHTVPGGGGGGPAITGSPGNGANGATGGGGGSTNGTGGVGSAGFAGGNANTTIAAGGGGGAGVVGQTPAGTLGGNGGAGVSNSISGAAVTYGGGGGGAGNNSGGTAGGGGGGVGGSLLVSHNGTNGTDNLGGGGGGSADDDGIPGNGGSGVVIISVPTGLISYVVTGSPAITTAGGNIIFTYTASGTFSYTLLPSQFTMGAKTRAGHGGCTDTASLPAGSTAFNNMTYGGAFSITFTATGTATSADNRYKIDSHNCLVPNGTYGNAPTVAPASGTYALTDGHGWTWAAPIVAVPLMWSIANIDAGTNADTISANQLLNVLQGTPGTTGPVMGDTISFRTGSVYDPPKFDTIGSATATCALCATPGDIRIKPVAYAAQATEFLTGNAGGPYTAKNLPLADWITITADTPYGATIRHVMWNGTPAGGRVIMGFRFSKLNMQLNYDGTHGFAQGVSTQVVGSGATTQSYLNFDTNTFQGNSPVVGQRGQQGISSTSVNNNGTSGCTTATIAYFDNNGGPPNGSGATATATIAGGVITAWTQNTIGANYDTAHSGTPGVPPAGAGTWATVTSSGCTSTPTATPNMNGLDIITGINSAANTTELYIHDNVFTDMWDGVNLTGNQTVAFSVPTNFFIIGNTFNRPWTASIQTSNAAPVYTEWNFTTNMQYASGAFHADCEIRLYAALQSGSTYPFGDVIGNICVRGQGLATWGDAQGWFSSNGAAGSILSGCKIEGNIFVGTFVNVVAIDNCDNTASVDFNTIVWDPVAGIVNPNQNGAAQSSGAGIITKYTTSAVINGQSTYNAVSGAQGVWTGGAPTVTCNKLSLGLGNSAASLAAYTAPPANFTTLQSIAAVSAAFQPKPGGTLLPPSTGCMYNVGTGGYFNYSNRTNSAPY